MHAEPLDRDRRLRLVEHQTVNRAFRQRGQLRGAASDLNDGDLFGVDSDFFQRDQQRHMVGRAETADGEDLALEISGFFNFRPGDQFRWKEI